MTRGRKVMCLITSGLKTRISKYNLMELGFSSNLEFHLWRHFGDQCPIFRSLLKQELVYGFLFEHYTDVKFACNIDIYIELICSKDINSHIEIRVCILMVDFMRYYVPLNLIGLIYYKGYPEDWYQLQKTWWSQEGMNS